jgi:hypothetical protein
MTWRSQVFLLNELMKNNRVVFATLISDEADRYGARLLIETLREFGGMMSQSRFWVFSINQNKPDPPFISDENVDFFPLQDINQENKYYFADKVRAWVQAETYACGLFDTLIWIDPACMVINPPTLFTLDDETKATFRPVHVRNIGQLFGQELDQFWRSIFTQCKTPDPSFTVNSFIDDQVIYPYFNTHCFSIAPKLGVLDKTLNHLNILNNNPEFMNTFCSDPLHKIFLFQAVLAATLLKEISEKQIRLLPPGYSYPLHLVDKIPAELSINELDELTVMVYEEKSILEASLSKIEISPGMRQWLENYITIQ